MAGSSITLDKKSFKALASDTRIAALKALDERRKTASELAKELALTVQSVSEHLDKLAEAGLVERAESERKWVYYSLTDSGRAVLHPGSARGFWVLLGISILAFAAALSRPATDYFTPQPFAAQALPTMRAAEAASAITVPAAKAGGVLAENAADAAATSIPKTLGAAAEATRSFGLSPLEQGLALVAVLLFLAAVFVRFRRVSR
ncbi:hypothetical protein AUJ14_05155 [Candidatus Micrarchaeota archaeon CG1_02_55_22]|nr:MAG: hypothetical protein AUJ14_05155 [Candidatus Micrarchaeota archaeon CG1_02_55_22]